MNESTKQQDPNANDGAQRDINAVYASPLVSAIISL